MLLDNGDTFKYHLRIMHRQMISFTDPQYAYLEQEAERLGISIAELVRRIVDEHRLGKT